MTVYKCSLRKAIQDTTYTSAGQGRVVLFEKSGIISLGNSLSVLYPYTTIAGQSGPSPGISLKNHSFKVQTHDVLIKHIRHRKTDDVAEWGSESVELVSGQNNYNVIIDHCTVSWGLDDQLTMYSSNSNISSTVSNCIVAEGLNDGYPFYRSKGVITQYGKQHISILRNVFAHNFQRNPMIGYDNSTVLINNVIYNCTIPTALNGSLSMPDSSDVSCVGNYYKKGANGASYAFRMYKFNDGGSQKSKIYLSVNYIHGTGTPEDQWTLVHYDVDCPDDEDDLKAESSAIDLSGFTQWVGADVVSNLIDNASPTSTLHTVGARPANRDSHDERIINDVLNGTGQIISTDPQLTLDVNTASLQIPSNPHGDDDKDGYTNMEEWLHELSARVEGRSQ